MPLFIKQEGLACVSKPCYHFVRLPSVTRCKTKKRGYLRILSRKGVMEKRDWFGKKSVRNLKCTMSMDFFVYYVKTPMNVCQNIICKTYIKMGIAIHPHQSKGNRVKANGKKTQCKKKAKILNFLS